MNTYRRQVNVKDMMFARDKRVSRQQFIGDRYSCTIISVSMNIAGPIKTSPLIEFCFINLLKIIHNSDFIIKYEEVINDYTGPYAVFAVDNDASIVKQWAINLETENDVGRLYDIDVISNGIKLSRESPRKCLICENYASVCARSRNHDVETLTKKANTIMLYYSAEAISSLAVQSLIEEVEVTPKPGLVDKNNSGSHKDMDITLFCKSAQSLKNYFANAVIIGAEALSLYELVNELTISGTDAEKDMFEVTQGVNTHKGMIYSFGIICGAIGYYFNTKQDNIINIAKELAKAKKIKNKKTTETHGGKVYLATGKHGIIDEAVSGFPHALEIFKNIQGYLSNGASYNDAYAFSLIDIMCDVFDSNIVYRGGEQGLAFVKNRAVEISKTQLCERKEKIKEFDQEMIRLNLSPGGCADLLALGIFFLKINELAINICNGE